MVEDIQPGDILDAARIRTKHSGRGGIVLQDYQVPPPDEEEWETFLMLGGRRIGKTFAGSHYTIKHLRKYQDVARVGIMAPTNKDARSICAEGVSGIISLFRDEFSERYGGKYLRTTGECWHRDGGFVQIKGAHEIESWRGFSWSMLWIDEWCLCDPEAIQNAILGLSEGPNPKVFVTTTPRPLQRLKDLIADPLTIMRHATTYDNKYLPQRSLERWERAYSGTRIGRQELLGEILDQEEGALWSHETLEANRVILPEDEKLALARTMQRLVVAIDPAVTATKDSDYTGICVVGRLDEDYYVFELEDMKVSPGQWARKALNYAIRYEADAIIGERNNGGDLVEHVIRNECREMRREGLWSGVDANVKTVVASRGKITRAEPIAALDEQGRVHHVGTFSRAEDQMCTFPITVENDDLVDARVWGISELDTALRTLVVTPINFTKRSRWKSIDREIA